MHVVLFVNERSYYFSGERAFQLEVIDYLTQGLQSDALNANPVISAISYGVVYR